MSKTVPPPLVDPEGNVLRGHGLAFQWQDEGYFVVDCSCEGCTTRFSLDIGEPVRTICDDCQLGGHTTCVVVGGHVQTVDPGDLDDTAEIRDWLSELHTATA